MVPGAGVAIPAPPSVAQGPSPRFVVAAGSVLALVLTLFSAFERVSVGAEEPLWPYVVSHLLADYASLSVVVLVVAVAGWVVPARLFLEQPAARALVFSLGPYTLGGIVGGIARYHVRLWLGLSWDVAFPWELWTNVGAGFLAFTMVGFLASQYNPLMERLERLRALRAIADQAVDIAAGGDFGRRLSLADRPDEVGHLARTVNHLLTTVEATLRSHREFLADTSHELRNPLQAIRVNLELIGRVADREAQEECVREALQQVELMSRLVSDLLTLARLEPGLIVDRRPVALHWLVGDAVREAGKEARGRQVLLRQAEEVEVMGDEGRLRQVLANLVTNALQHTPPDGQINVALEQRDGWVQLHVEDNGEGIAPEHLPYVFDRFYRAAKTSSSGTGLGLAIVKHLCEAHGGYVTVESEPSHGSRFTVWLPALSDESDLSVS